MANEATTPAEERISQLQGRRLCAACHYNLAGQTVLREPHYGMLIVRCPECGTVGAADDPAHAGRWTARGAVTVYLCWIVFVAALSLAGAGIVTGTCGSIADEVAAPYRAWLHNHYYLWYQEANDTPPQPSGWTLDQFAEWLEANPLPELAAEFASEAPSIFRAELLMTLAPAAMAAALAVVLCLAMLHRRPRTLLVASLLVVLLVGAAWAAAWSYSATEVASSFRDIARAQVFFPALGIAFLVSWVAFAIGLFVARPVARSAVRVLLPPERRSFFWALWAADGLPPPRSKGAPS